MDLIVHNIDNLLNVGETIDIAQNIAQNVFTCVMQTQNNIFEIHGDLSDSPNKEEYPIYNDILENTCSYLPNNHIANIYPNNSNISLILSGLNNNHVIIHGKINHLLIRKSNMSKVQISFGTISGVDILYSHNMIVCMPNHTFTNLEYDDRIFLYAQMDKVSQLHITGSLDIQSNNINIPINPFTDIMISQDTYDYKNKPVLPDLMLFNE